MEYDIRAIYAHANDSRGHNVQFRVSFQPGHADAMERLAKKGLIPGIESPQDIMRDGAYHRMHWYITEYSLSEEMAPFMELVEAEREFALMKKTDDIWKQLVRDVEELMVTRGGTFSEQEVREKVEELYAKNPPAWVINALDDVKNPRRKW